MAIQHLTSTIRSNKSQGMHTCVISLDVRGAFSNVWWPYLKYRLLQINCPNNLYRLICNYLTDRFVSFTYGSNTTTKQYFKGCPQGSVSGPLLWNIVADPALSISPVANTSILAYADDLLLIVAASRRHTLEINAQLALDALSNWSNSAKLKFCPSKTKLITFPKGTDMKRLPSVKFMNNPIKASTTLKYLGVILDSQLTWTPHLKQLKQRCATISNKLNGMATRKWGLNKRVRKAIYLNGIERMITYACGAWWRTERNVKMRQYALQIQRISALSLTKCFKTVSTAAMQVLAGIIPLDIVLDYETTMHNLLHNNTDINLWSIHIPSNVADLPKPSGLLHPADLVVIPWDDSPPSSVGMELFTDGSKTLESVGAAFCALHDGHIYHHAELKLSSNATIFQAEGTAILAALQWIISSNSTSTSFSLYSDSKSVLSSLNSAYSKCAIISQILSTILNYNLVGTVSFHWVRSHTGIPGNELADHYANSARSLPNTSISTLYSIPSIRSRLKLAAVDIWNTRWNLQEDKGRFTARIYPKVSTKRILGDCLINQILTNHGILPGYFSRFNLKNCHCNCGHPHDSIAELLYQCVQLRQQRTNFIAHIPRPLRTVSGLANSNFHKGLKSLMDFVALNETKLFTSDDTAFVGPITSSSAFLQYST